MSEAAIVLFDGVCNFCDSSVQFIFRRDRQGRFRFAPLQSEKGRQLLAAAGLPRDTLETMVLFQGGRVFTRSTAALRIARGLAGLWPLLYVFLLVPRFIRDPVYDWVARNRYKWFGRKESCMIPSAEMRHRFIE